MWELLDVKKQNIRARIIKKYTLIVRVFKYKFKNK